MSLRTDVIYRVIESPTTHTYVALSEDGFEETFHSAKRARFLTGRDEIVVISAADYDALKES